MPEEVAVGVTCDVLGEAALSPGDLNLEKLKDIVWNNVVQALAGDEASLLATVNSIADDLSAGTADSALWARVTILKLQYC